MGREIEIKIPLSAEEYQKLFDLIFNKENAIDGVTVKRGACTDGWPRLITKRDEYWSKYNSREERLTNNEPQVIRLRSEDDGKICRSFFTIKYKKKENGIEFNREDETFVEDAEVLREFFAEAGYHKWFDKVKKSSGAYCLSTVLPGVEFHLEMEKVNDLPYVEIEVTDDQMDAESVRKGLEDFVLQLGLNPQKRDSRSWVEILNQK